MKRSLCRIFRPFSRPISTDSKTSLELLDGAYLNKYAGLETEIEEDLDEDLDWDNSVSRSPIGQIQASKPVIKGGPIVPLGVNSKQRRGKGFRSKLAEERYKLAHMVFEGDVRVRVMDVDRFELNELHEYFMYTLVRRFPSEDCMRVASRIAVFRDKNTQHSFESLSRDMAVLFGPTHGPELTALFARCYGTIPVPFMLDYIRRFGKFSRKFIAQEVEKTIAPRAFDFVRYEGGVKPLPGFVVRPFALRSFARMLPPCAVKRYMFQHLLAHSADHGEAFASKYFIDPNVPLVAKIGDRVAQNKLQQVEADVYSHQPTSPEQILAALDESPLEDKEEHFSSQFTLVQKFSGNHLEPATEKNPSEDAIQPTGWWKEGEIFRDFFRYNKKAYRLDQEKGWTQVEDPRGPAPDYARQRSLKLGAKRVRNHYARNSRKKNRNDFIKKVVTNRLRQL